MEVQALTRYARMSPKKVREVVRTIQGRKATDAVDYLTLIPRKSAKLIACPGCYPTSIQVPLVPLLRFQRQGCHRARFQTLDADRIARLLAIAVGAVLDAGERLVDLGDQLALAVASAQFDRAVGFRGGTIRQVGVIDVFFL